MQQLKEQQKNFAETIQSISQFYNIKNQSNLVKIILNPRLSNKLFHKDRLMMFKIFDQDKRQKTQKQKLQIYAHKYTFEKLCEKFQKPRGTSQLLKQILEIKIKTSIIQSHQTRKQIWMLASGAKYYMNSNKEMYRELHEYKDYPQYFVRPIDLDLGRTVNRSNSTAQQQLQAMKRLLISFSRRNPFIGYCQGLNFIANFILTMQFTQQQGFWLLSQIIETIIPMDYYTNMIGVVSDQKIFIQVIKQHNPKLYEKFQQVGLDPSVFTIQWFVCLFTSSMPFYLVRILWDRLIIQGMTTLLKAGIILLQQFQEDILQSEQFPEIIILIEEKSKKLNLSEQDFNSRFEDIYISKQGLQLARELYREYHLKEKLTQKVNKTKNTNKNYLANVKCNLQWPICLHMIEKYKKERQETQVWIFRQNNQPRFINDYCQKQYKSHNRSNSPSKQQTELKIKQSNIVFGRMAHICDVKGYSDLREKIKVPMQIEMIQSKTQKKQNNKEQQIYNIEKRKYLSNLNIIFQMADQTQGTNQLDSNMSKRQQNSNSKKKIIPDDTNKLVPKSMIQLRKSKSIYFYKKFMNDNKELGQIISKPD